MKMKSVLLMTALLVSVSFGAYAQDSAMDQLQDAAETSNDAVYAPTDEQAHDTAGQVFDGNAAVPPVVAQPDADGGSSGLSNAPTYSEDTGSGLDNAPTY